VSRALGTYALYRVLGAIPVVFGITLLVFVMVRLVPGDPVDVILGDQRQVTEERRQEVRERLGLDRSIPEQYIIFLANAARGDLGRSFRNHLPVMDEIRHRLPNTLKLAAASLVFAFVIGVVIGVTAATFKGRFVDVFTMTVATLCVSIPGFWLGIILIMLLAVRLGWFPVAGADTWKHLVLPAVTLGLRSAGSIARVARASMLDVLAQDYVRTARAKGLGEATVIYGHALRNAMIPILTVLGFEVGGLMTGAFIVEVVFAYPGIGSLGVQAVIARDFPIVQGVVMFIALTYVCVNLLVDLLYGVLDPRVRYGQ
jgi:peptide/nickel transport system permease protein